MKPQPGSWQNEVVELLTTLKRHKVRFLVAGGYAVARAGYLRATKDIDLYVPRTRGTRERLAEALGDFFGAPLPEGAAYRTFLRFHVGRPGAFGVIRKLPGVTWKTAWEGRSTGKLFGLRVPFLGIDELIRNKRAVGRHLDLADVEQLVQIRDERKRRGR